MYRLLALMLTLALGTAAHAAAPSDARTELALELMKVTDFDRTLKAMQDQMTPMFEQQMSSQANYCSAAAPVAKRYSTEMSAKVGAALQSDDMKVDIAALYAEVFDEDELRQVIAFYKSPLGAKLLARMPELTQKSMQVSQRRMQALMPQISETSERYVSEVTAACSDAKTPEPTSK